MMWLACSGVRSSTGTCDSASCWSASCPPPPLLLLLFALALALGCCADPIAGVDDWKPSGFPGCCLYGVCCASDAERAPSCAWPGSSSCGTQLRGLSVGAPRCLGQSSLGLGACLRLLQRELGQARLRMSNQERPVCESFVGLQSR